MATSFPTPSAGDVWGQQLLDAIADRLTPVVFVATGSEPRPAGALVFWVGGEAQPTNMAATDLWFAPTSAPAPGGDTVDPTAPTNLTASAITTTGFSVDWDASTDNVGVTGYDVYRDGTLAGSVTVTTANISGLTADTAYSITVTARDAVGNISAESVPLVVTTSVESGTPQHSIWGGGAYPWAIVKSTDTPLIVANHFYSYGSSPDVSAWRVVGGKLWIPVGASVTGPVQIMAWLNTDLGGATVGEATITSPTAGQWNTAYFPAPIETNSGDVVKIGYRFPNGDYFGFTGALPEEFVAATDGSHIVLAEISSPYRSSYKYDGGVSTDALNTVYGIDVIYDEGA